MNTDTKRLTQEKISKILDLHGKWLHRERGGVQANLSGANLRDANLRDASLEYANLTGANLTGANLTGANLTNAKLTNANLSGANLSGANLYGANLYGANLSGANLRDASLEYANLTNADLYGVNLRDANLEGAILRGAKLGGAKLEGAKLPPSVLDLSGCTVGYKKVWNKNRTKQVVIELRFPEGTKLVSTVVGRKCRASEAVVVGCVTPRHKSETLFWSLYDYLYSYRVGETVRPTEPFDDSITEECTSGIHFSATREEAEEYDY